MLPAFFAIAFSLSTMLTHWQDTAPISSINKGCTPLQGNQLARAA